jgi:hypothetical protein
VVLLVRRTWYPGAVVVCWRFVAEIHIVPVLGAVVRFSSTPVQILLIAPNMALMTNVLSTWYYYQCNLCCESIVATFMYTQTNTS